MEKTLPLLIIFGYLSIALIIGYMSEPTVHLEDNIDYIENTIGTNKTMCSFKTPDATTTMTVMEIIKKCLKNQSLTNK